MPFWRPRELFHKLYLSSNSFLRAWENEKKYVWRNCHFKICKRRIYLSLSEERLLQTNQGWYRGKDTLVEHSAAPMKLYNFFKYIICCLGNKLFRIYICVNIKWKLITCYRSRVLRQGDWPSSLSNWISIWWVLKRIQTVNLCAERLWPLKELWNFIRNNYSLPIQRQSMKVC